MTRAKSTHSDAHGHTCRVLHHPKAAGVARSGTSDSFALLASNASANFLVRLQLELKLARELLHSDTTRTCGGQVAAEGHSHDNDAIGAWHEGVLALAQRVARGLCFAGPAREQWERAPADSSVGGGGEGDANDRADEDRKGGSVGDASAGMILNKTISLRGQREMVSDLSAFVSLFPQIFYDIL
ncbi:LOW QUALITY PROTEIN: hypothetical protein CVT25_015110 [Psilocybe cyanescens]|uniref:Uncharacterized protein n=1 Tax=Psilocybe cyanescens TaxID=93625 RepID=A0A409WUH0_PSICY|nr:LOW QUALITY PROTEIN: hypothetical protein CVT25_015110 [Psilocybe cyanescens]